jgi:hypothetical protein
MFVPFKKVLQVKAIFLLFIAAILCASCSDSNEESPDVSGPQVTLTGITSNADVSDTVSIAVSADDEKDIEKLAVYIDGTLVTTLTQPPFAYSWNTYSLKDGVHTVKIIAFDKTGNSTEQQVSVNVKNILVSFDVPSNKLWAAESYSERGFVFLSDENGKVIASTEYENGKSYTLTNREFKGDQFFLSEVVIRTNSEENRIVTYLQVKRGTKWVLVMEKGDNETYAGNATLTFSNGDDKASYYAVSNGDETSPNEENPKVRLHESPSNLYVVRSYANESKAPAYGIFTGITAGATTAVDLSKVTTPLTKVTLELPQNTTSYTSLQMNAYTKSNSFDIGYATGRYTSNAGNTKLDYYYPGTAFPSYYSKIFVTTDDYDYEQGSTQILSEVKLPESNVTFSFANDKLNYSASGDFKFMMAGIEYEDARWILLLPKETGVVPSIELPEQLKDFKLPAFGSPVYYAIEDVAGITNYSDLINFITTSTYGVNEFYIAGKNYIDVTYREASSGGRIASNKKAMHLLIN